MFSRYFTLLEKRPIKTKAASAVVLFSISDIIAQAYEYAENEKLLIGAGQSNSFEENQTGTKVALPPGSTFELFSGFCNDYSPKRTLRIAAFGCAITVWLVCW